MISVKIMQGSEVEAVNVDANKVTYVQASNFFEFSKDDEVKMGVNASYILSYEEVEATNDS